MIFTDNHIKLERAFKKENLKLSKRYELLGKKLKANNEIKGSDIKEKRKTELYQKMVEKHGDLFEIGLIVLDNNYASDQLSSVKARCFNFLIQEYMTCFYKKHSKFMNNKNFVCKNMSFIIDERNIKSEAKHRLREYLIDHLNAYNPVCTNSINVAYTDSKNKVLVQFADYVANTFYRNLMKNEESYTNTDILSKKLCNESIFIFPIKSDVSINTNKNYSDNIDNKNKT